MFYEVVHPCIQDKMTILRNRESCGKQFRECVKEITWLVAYEALKNLELTPVKVETPLVETVGYRIRNEVVIVPILRAGLGMMDALLQLIPNASLGFVGFQRDEATAKPQQYYHKLPAPTPDSMAIVVDPMLATGGSLAAAVDVLKRSGFENIVVLTLLAAPEGVAVMNERHPDVKVYSGSLDQGLNEHKYIVPGLGDAGDRLFGTI